MVNGKQQNGNGLFTWRMGGSTQSKQTGHSKSEARSWFVVAPEEEVCDELLMFNSDELEVGVPDDGVLTAEQNGKCLQSFFRDRLKL